MEKHSECPKKLYIFKKEIFPDFEKTYRFLIIYFGFDEYTVLGSGFFCSCAIHKLIEASYFMSKF